MIFEMQTEIDISEMSEKVQRATIESVLSRIDLFAEMPKPHLRRVIAIGVEEIFKRGRTVFAEGDLGDEMYVVLEGAARVTRMVPGVGEEALAILPVGAYFGEMSLLDDAPRSATVIAHENLRLFVIHRRDLEDLLFVDRDLAYQLLWNFVRTLTQRLRTTNDKMALLAASNKF